MKSKKSTCNDQCPVQRTASLLEGKWTIVIVRDLLSGPKRYSQLKASVGDISPRMLASRLRQLTEAGVVRRKVYPTIPPKTEYALTTRGAELLPVIQAMAAFGEGFAQDATRAPAQS